MFRFGCIVIKSDILSRPEKIDVVLSISKAGPRSERGYIERNAIALLSNYRREALDAASSGWLGRSCNRALVRESHLWNNRHVAEDYDPAFVDRLEALVKA